MMKRFFAVITVALILCTAYPRALAAPSITLDYVVDGDKLTVSVVFWENPGIIACDFNIGFDSSRLRFTGAAAAHGGTFVNEVNPSEVKLVWLNPDGDITFDGSLFDITFQIMDKATPTDLKLSIASIVNEMYQDVSFNMTAHLTVLFEGGAADRPNEAGGEGDGDGIDVEAMQQHHDITITGFGNTTGQALKHYRVTVRLADGLMLIDDGLLSDQMNFTQTGEVLEWYAKTVPPGFAEKAVITLGVRPGVGTPTDKPVCIVSYQYLYDDGPYDSIADHLDPAWEYLRSEEIHTVWDIVCEALSTPLHSLESHHDAGDAKHLRIPWHPILLLILGIGFKLYGIIKNLRKKSRP